MMVRREVIETVGLLDEGFFMYPRSWTGAGGSGQQDGASSTCLQPR